MNYKRIISLCMVVVGVGLVMLVISLDEPTINAWMLAICATLLLVLANEVE